jgi:hypothetical protein
MYKCSKCGKGVLVIENQEPVRICDCKVTIELPSGEVKEKLAPIICDMEGTAYGRSQFKS